MKKMLVFLLAISVLFSCAREKDAGKKIIVTTVFPLYDFVRNIKSEEFEVRLLLPPGAEIHSFDPAPKDMVYVANAQLFVYIGVDLEPWALDLVKAAVLDKRRILSVMDEIPLPQVEDTKIDDKTDLEHGKDPHVWLDFKTDILIVNSLARRLIEIDPQHSKEILEKTAAYAEKLLRLDEQYEATISGAKWKTVIFAGHNAFGSFTARYGLEFITPYQGFSPDAEPSAMKIKELVDKIVLLGVPVIYYEELIQPKLAEILTQETSVKMMLLNAAHNIGKDDLLENADFIEIMEQNLTALKVGLN